MWQLAPLPPAVELETKAVLKKAVAARSALAELKGLLRCLPDPSILLGTLPLLEAIDSSAVEDISTTPHELLIASLQLGRQPSKAAAEVLRYVSALKAGFEPVKQHGFLTINHIQQIQQELEENIAGFRRAKGTVLKNQQTGQVVYTPPQSYNVIAALMINLEQYINDNELSDADPLVKMAVLHFQFESIHPFYDGNGRTGRILNILYLVLQGLLDLPILYLSRYIFRNRAAYYQHLQALRETGDWEPWLLYMLQGVEETTHDVIALITQLQALQQQLKQQLRSRYSFYSHKLLNHLSRHPYTKVGMLQLELGSGRTTAAGYLNQLTTDGLLEKHKLGPANYYINRPLLDLMSRQNT